ncbi:MAG: HAD-IA family hydrolase [Acidobacteria bacterium]|nr:HAD-IA family hydrolase [Acidobacteriota bacterium]
MAAARGILFDFDYTLADSSRAVVECVRVAFDSMALSQPLADSIRRTIGLSLPETFRVLSGQDGDARVEEFRSHFRNRSNEIMVDWTEFLPGVAGVVEALTQRPLKLGIVSTKYRSRIEATLLRDGLASYFETIVGGDDVAENKPDPGGLLMAASRLGFSLDELIYVGDSVTDAEAAQRAKMPFAAVLTGPTRGEEFDSYSPLARMTKLAELPGHLDRWTR